MAAAAAAGVEAASRETKAVVGAALLALRGSQQEVSAVAATFRQLPTHAAERAVNAAYPELQARLDAASAAVTGVFQYMSTQGLSVTQRRGLRGFTYELCEEPARKPAAAPPQ
jgi:hypothetical protein